MADTKARILQTSLKLFNEFGLSEVSQRRISDRMMISPGNLTYHFKRKEDISEALYFQLVEQLDQLHSKLNHARLSLTTMAAFSKALFGLFYAYRFIFLDFVQLMKNSSKIRAHYNELLVLRKTQFQQICALLIEEGLIRTEEIESEYDLLFTRTQVLTDFYLSSIEITTDKVQENHLQSYLDLLMSSIYPYLTAKGKLEYYENFGDRKVV